MSGLNKVTLIGNLGRDPEMHYTPEGVPVTDFSLAVSDGSKVETVWFRVSCWRNLAETINKHLKKGVQVYVEGRLRPKQFEGKDGKSHSALDVVAEKVVFLGRKLDGIASASDAELETANPVVKAALEMGGKISSKVPSENGDSAGPGDDLTTALDSNGDGLPIQPKAEAVGLVG